MDLDSKKEYTDPGDIANRLNMHFQSIGGKMAQKVNPKGKKLKDPLDYITTSLSEEAILIIFRPTTAYECCKKITELNGRKATGPDEISHYLLKITCSILAPVIANLFNECMAEGTFPDELKIAKIIPVHKGDAKDNPTNYRPISLLPILGKLFEKILADRLLEFLNENNILTQNQFGFRKNYSTELAIADIYNNLLDNLEKKKHTCAVFLDLAKAFDSVDHTILLKKLHKYGIRGKAHELMKSYLRNRQQYVNVSDADSLFLILEYGVPQGSVLGPLLFLLFINDLPNCTNFKVTLFADDTFLRLESENLNTLKREANKEMENVSKWLISNKLTLNIIKSNYMIISKQKIPENDFILKLNGKNLKRCQQYKYLGLIVDQSLSWKPHIQGLCDKLGRMSGVFAKLRHCANISTVKSVYYALVYSRLQYCNLIWGNASKEIIKPLNVIVDRIVRIMSFAPFQTTSTQQFFDELELLNLSKIHKLEKAKFVFKYKNSKLPANFENYFQQTGSNHRYPARSGTVLNYRVPKTNSCFGRKKMQCDGAIIWNNIPLAIKECKSLKNFAGLFKAYLIHSVE